VVGGLSLSLLLSNISVMYALYCLVMLFHAVNEELRYPVDWRPLGKFLCVKGVVFFTWWQGVIIFYLKAHGIIDKVGAWSSEDVANGLIDYCVVIEMIAFAIAHSYTFTYKEYLPSNFEHVHQNGNGGDNNNESPNNPCNDHENGGNGRSSNYRPPATLPQPMKFKDAFWSSAVPRETLQDIQRLRSGVDGAIQDALRPRAISLQAMNSEEELLFDAVEAPDSNITTA
jgi:Organic solute transporter Ostalpha